MSMTRMKWSFVGLALLGGVALGLIYALDQGEEAPWETSIAAGQEASRQGNYAEAEPLYARALAIMEKAPGPERPGLIKILETSAALLGEAGRGAEAKEMATRAKQAKEKPAN
ncbi:MAG: tetratricopeptide repeat protein [Proteobacteria bacterium]|nr:tetratricopeptide repeat protein [Pseudomonadota bacterium]